MVWQHMGLVQHRSLGHVGGGLDRGWFLAFFLLECIFVFDLTAVPGCRHLPVSYACSVYDGMVFQRRRK